MPRLIKSGDTIKNFGQRLPVPYIERVEIQHTSFIDSELTAFVAEVEAAGGTVYDEYDELTSLTVKASLMFNTDDSFLLEDFKNEIINDYYINFLIVAGEENITNLKKSRKNLKQIVQDSDFATGTLTDRETSYNMISVPMTAFTDEFVLTEDRDDDYNRIIKSSDLSVTFVRPQKPEEQQTLTVFAFTAVEPMGELLDYSNIVFAMNFSDLAYEDVVRDGSVAVLSSEGYFSADGSYYTGVPLLGLNGRYHSTENYGVDDIVSSIQTLTGRYQRYRNKNKKIHQAITDIDFILAKYYEDPKLLVQLSKYGTMFPNAGAGSRIGRLYENFKIAVNNANTFLIEQPIVQKKLIRNAKIQDNRFLANNVESQGTYNADYIDEDFLYPIAIQTNISKFEEVDPNTGNSGAEVAYDYDAMEAEMREAIGRRLAEIPHWRGDHIADLVSPKLDDLVNDAASFFDDRMFEMVSWLATGLGGVPSSGVEEFYLPKNAKRGAYSRLTWQTYTEAITTAHDEVEDTKMYKAAKALFGRNPESGDDVRTMYWAGGGVRPTTINKCTLEIGIVDSQCNQPVDGNYYKCFVPFWDTDKIARLSPTTTLLSADTRKESSDWDAEYVTYPGIIIANILINPRFWDRLGGDSTAENADDRSVKDDIRNALKRYLTSAEYFDPFSSAVGGRMSTYMDNWATDEDTYEWTNTISNWIGALFHSVLYPLIGDHPRMDDSTEGGKLWRAFNNPDRWETWNTNYELTDPVTGDIIEDNVNKMINEWCGVGSDDGGLGNQLKTALDDLWDSAMGTVSSAGALAIRWCPDDNKRDTWGYEGLPAGKSDTTYNKYGGDYPDLYPSLSERNAAEQENPHYPGGGSTFDVPAGSGYDGEVTTDGEITYPYGPGRGAMNIKKEFKKIVKEIYNEEYKEPLKEAMREIIRWLAQYHGVSLGEGRHNKLANVNIWVQKYGWFFFDMEKFILYQSAISRYLDPTKIEAFLDYGRDMINDTIRLSGIEFERKSQNNGVTWVREPTGYYRMGIRNATDHTLPPFEITQASYSGDADQSPPAVKALSVSSWRDFKVDNDTGDLLVDGEAPSSMRLWASLIPRNVDFPQEENIPDDYRLMAFNYNSFIDDDIAMHLGDRYEITVEVYDQSVQLIKYLTEILREEVDKLSEYYEKAIENCAFNRFDSEFNTFFRESMAKVYDPPTTAPWVTAPAVYTTFLEIYSGFYGGDYYTALDEARKIMDSINPETGWLEGLVTFRTNLARLAETYSNLDRDAWHDTSGYSPELRSFTVTIDKDEGGIIDYHTDGSEFGLPDDWRDGGDEWFEDIAATGTVSSEPSADPAFAGSADAFDSEDPASEFYSTRVPSIDSAHDYGFVRVDPSEKYDPSKVLRVTTEWDIDY